MTPASSRPTPVPPPREQSGRRLLHLVDFFCRAPEAKSVSLVGDFNDWAPTAHPMNRMPDGGWVIRLELPHGHHQYLFLVDGKPTLDPNAMGKVRNGSNETVSLIAIS
jgi:1,4-alpha-glucan branching enzyme